MMQVVYRQRLGCVQHIHDIIQLRVVLFRLHALQFPAHGERRAGVIGRIKVGMAVDRERGHDIVLVRVVNPLNGVDAGFDFSGKYIGLGCQKHRFRTHLKSTL
jgi:hypothetical protein